MGEQIDPHAVCANCSGVHRFWVHEGRKRICTMASCHCAGFSPAPEPTAEEIYQSQLEQMKTNDTASLNGHSHKRMHLRASGDSNKWFDKDGAPCPSCEV